MEINPETAAAANSVAEELDADILFYSGAIEQPRWHKTVGVIRARRRRKHILLVLVTPGGDPDAAFKIGRCLQSKYPNGVYSFIPGWCKSAGTLLALSSKRIYISDYGELGPLDIQIRKADELDEMGSGLLIDSAMKTLEQTAQKMFISALFSIRKQTSITTRTAAEHAVKMVTQLLAPIYQQIEPVKIGENARAMNITKSYGMRLALSSGIFRDIKTLDFLISSYPDHGFVIDRQEANLLFTDVREPSEAMMRLSDALGERAILPKDDTITFLSDETPEGTVAAAATPKARKTQTHAKGTSKANGRSGNGAGKQPARIARD